MNVVLSRKKIVVDFSNGTYGINTIYGHMKPHTPKPYELSVYLLIGDPGMQCLFISQRLDFSLIRNCITVPITAAKFGSNAKVFEMT